MSEIHITKYNVTIVEGSFILDHTASQSVENHRRRKRGQNLDYTKIKITNPHKNNRGSLTSTAYMNKMVGSTQKMNYVIREDVDPLREIIVDSGAFENVSYDIPLFNSTIGKIRLS